MKTTVECVKWMKEEADGEVEVESESPEVLLLMVRFRFTLHSVLYKINNLVMVWFLFFSRDCWQNEEQGKITKVISSLLLLIV